MQGLRGIADVDLVAGDARGTHLERERLHRSALDPRAMADGSSHGVEFRQEIGLACRDQALSALRPQAPDEGIPPGVRQQRERPFRCEALERGRRRGRLGMQYPDERILRIALAFDILRRAFGVHDAARRNCFCRNRQLGPQARREGRVFGDIAERWHAGIRSIEPCAAEAAGLRNHDALDRRRRQAGPRAEPLEDQPAGVGNGDRAEARRRGGRVGKRDAQSSGAQRECQRAADRAGAPNENVSVYGFVDEHVFLTKTGDLGVVLEVEGVDYECLDHKHTDGLAKRLESALRLLGPQFRVYQFLFKSTHEQIPRGSYDNPVVKQAIDDRAAYFDKK